MAVPINACNAGDSAELTNGMQLSIYILRGDCLQLSTVKKRTVEEIDICTGQNYIFVR